MIKKYNLNQLNKKVIQIRQNELLCCRNLSIRFGKDCIAGIIADCEFIGGDWFKWLLDEKISFYIRIRNNTIATNSRGLPVDIDVLFYGFVLCNIITKHIHLFYSNKITGSIGIFAGICYSRRSSQHTFFPSNSETTKKNNSVAIRRRW